ncbi:tol-pal system protein YbgF [Methylohalomonas lacus]|uniref:Cell division coordinator CpoB n=1 Tax=Methylohalomonas lacus TaxID=398773 RepID=A0AAE3HN08_9GAMM|nr:tol-pal system protein YbgF [Methylohalomonas lacus]MCS3904192.1 tol-pal system protein YbgF [Methylohalomonas lacus]
MMSSGLYKSVWWLPVVCLALPGVAAAGNAAPVVSPVSEDVVERLERIERTLNNQSLLDLYNEVQSLEEQVQSLRGQLESQQHLIEEMRQRQKELYADVDERLQTIEDGSERGAGGEDQFSDDFRVDDSLAADDSDAADSDAASDVPTGSDDARADYDAAFDMLKAGRYDDSIKAFEQFLDNHPDSEYAGNAGYWLGEAHYVNRDFEQAIAAYQRVLDDYSDSAKVPDALLKLGYSQQELGNKEQARNTLQDLRERYPETTAASLARDRLQQL